MCLAKNNNNNKNKKSYSAIHQNAQVVAVIQLLQGALEGRFRGVMKVQKGDLGRSK